jgi:hypothetical protein
MIKVSKYKYKIISNHLGQGFAVDSGDPVHSKT